MIIEPATSGLYRCSSTSCATTYTGKYKHISIVVHMTVVINRMVINKRLFV